MPKVFEYALTEEYVSILGSFIPKTVLKKRLQEDNNIDPKIKILVAFFIIFIIKPCCVKQQG
ncbi:MAG: hypothetical protein K0Q95_208 [Bacteroidota bacterium]|nr:hypothetical protein [Bacteroidota bacterium]